MIRTSKQLFQAEELAGYEESINQYFKSLNAARKKLLEGSDVEFGYIMEKLEAIENQTHRTRNMIRQIERDEGLNKT